MPARYSCRTGALGERPFASNRSTRGCRDRALGLSRLTAPRRWFDIGDLTWSRTVPFVRRSGPGPVEKAIDEAKCHRETDGPARKYGVGVPRAGDRNDVRGASHPGTASRLATSSRDDPSPSLAPANVPDASTQVAGECVGRLSAPVEGSGGGQEERRELGKQLDLEKDRWSSLKDAPMEQTLNVVRFAASEVVGRLLLAW